MNTNYKILAFTFIINLFMALSLNSFISSEVFLPAIFLYFLSNLASFSDKAWYYTHNGYRGEKIISYICLIICIVSTCFYIAHALNFIEIVFYSQSATYKMLIQGTSGSFFTFHAIDITYITTAFILFIPFASLLLCIIPFISSHGYTPQIICDILKNSVKAAILIIGVSLGLGLLGILICHIKSLLNPSSIGTPQYGKYFLAASILSLTIGFCGLIIIKKNKLYSKIPAQTIAVTLSKTVIHKR